jgi:hypothetical protein
LPTLLRIVVVALAVHVTAISAGADPIQVVAGSLSVDTGDPPSFRLVTADGRTYLGEEFATNWDLSCFFECPAGTSIPLSMAPAGPDGEGVLVRDDGVSGFPVIRLVLSAPAVTLGPDTGIPRVEVFQAPFTFAGQITAFPNADLSGAPLFDVALTGAGIANLSMFVENGLYSFSSIDYVFDETAPVPEPATVLLVSAGSALMWRRRRAPTAQM